MFLYRDFNLLKSDFNKSLFKKNQFIKYEIDGETKKGKIMGLIDHERFQILNLNGIKETPKVTDVKIIY